MSGGGFGGGPFGGGGFGEWPWSLATIVEGIPAVYREQDELAGNGLLRALLEGLTPSMDGLRRDIRDYDQLRDPLVAPIDTGFDVTVAIIRVDNQGDGTSLVFISSDASGTSYQGIRPGMVLIDNIGNRFTIESVHSSALPADVDNPPVDPLTMSPTGRHVAVSNIGQASTELIPFTSSTVVLNERPSAIGATGSITAVAKALFIDGETLTLQDGINSSVVFEFDTASNGVTPGRVEIDIGLATSAIDVATSMVDAINTASNLNLLATNAAGTTAIVTLVNVGAGGAGNSPAVTWSDTVADAGFLITQPVGGAAGAFVLDPIGMVDGVSLSPYTFNTSGVIALGPAIAPNRIDLTWLEGGLLKSGFFTAEGVPGGDLADASIVRHETTAPDLAAGQFVLYNDSGSPIDAASIQVNYSLTPATLPTDAKIYAQNILAFLASDYGIKLDRNDPEFLQRSYVNNAFKIWDIKGTAPGYSVLGQYAGYFVNAKPLYSINSSVAAGLPSAFVFELPEGNPAVGSIQAVPFIDIVDGETFTLDDGINAPVAFEFDTLFNGVTPGRLAVDISSAISSIDVASAIVAAINLAINLNLNASNGSGSSSVITIVNAENGTSGNVSTWSSTVAVIGFVITQPTGGIDSDLFTTINPGRAVFDDLALDALPLDLLCSSSEYPKIEQDATALSVVLIRNEGSNKRSLVTMTTATAYASFATDGVFHDLNGAAFDIENFTRINATTYTFEVVNFLLPVIGAGYISWNVFAFSAIPASGILTFSSNPINTESVTFGTLTYTFQTVLTNVAGNVLIGANAGESLANLLAAVMLGAGAGAVYAAATLVHPSVSVSLLSGLTMSVVALIAGPAGNSIAIATTVTGSSITAATLLGGSLLNQFSIAGVGVDVIDLGFETVGYTGRRYRIIKQFINPPLAGIGNWAFIDSTGTISYIEKFIESPTAGTYWFEIISASAPAAGFANIFYRCEIVTACDFCRASSILVKISPGEIVNYPEALQGDALSRLILRLSQMIPGHVRISAFIFDPGPSVAAWGSLVASSSITEHWSDDGIYTAIYDEDEFPADVIPADSAPIIASSEVTITNQNVLEEYLAGPNPLTTGSWTATGQWQTTEYRSSTDYTSFSFGADDVGRLGDPGAVAPNYDNGAISTGTLVSPTVSVGTVSTVNLKFRHFGQMRAGGVDDIVSVLVVDETGPSTVQTVTKADLGLLGSGTNGGFTSFSVDIGPAVIGNGNFHLEFVFNSGTTTAGQTGEGWYVDDIEIQVIP